MPIVLEYNCLNCGIFCRRSNTAGKYCSNKCQHEHQMLTKVKTNTASSKTMKRYLIETNGYFCEECGIDSYNNKPIVLELEHKNGNSSDNSLDNVCLLCPNCHSQTDTYKAKNVGNGRHSRRLRYREGKSY
jgi:hypothetical protein